MLMVEVGLLAHSNVNKIDVSFSCVCPVIDHEFRHNIVKVAVDPQGDSHMNFTEMFVLSFRAGKNFRGTPTKQDVRTS